MPLIVMKFGGTSMGSLERIGNVARRAVARRRAGDRIVIVVSAMAGETDRLLGMAGEIGHLPQDREVDVLLATGEQVSIALLALAIRKQGCEARSFLGHQVQIRTDSVHGSARIHTIAAQPVHETLDKGEIVVIAGFQGVNEHGDITTLGRGGSDLSAVAMAAALKADACEIYSDVDGIYTTDPNLYAKARRIERISCEEMLELASLGAKVLQTRSVEFALKFKVPIHCRSSFHDGEGTWVLPGISSASSDSLAAEGDMVVQGLEGAVVTGVACDRNTAHVTVMDLPDRPGVAAALFRPLAGANVNVDVIIQNPGRNGRTDLSFTVPRGDADRVTALCEALRGEVGFGSVFADKDVAKVSVVGAGMRSQPGVALRAFDALGHAGVNILLISTSEIKISCVVADLHAQKAVQVLHDAFELDKTP